MTTIYYVRHAQPDFSVHDDLTRPLTEQGARDAKRVTKALAGIPIDAVYSSPFRRAVDTLADFAAHTGHSIVTDDRLCERRVDKVWIDDFDGFARKQWADFTYRLDDGESLGEVQARNIAALEDIVRRHENQSVVIGGHGTALATILAHYLPEFGYEDFQAFRGLFPYLVRFSYDGSACTNIEAMNVFDESPAFVPVCEEKR